MWFDRHFFISSAVGSSASMKMTACSQIFAIWLAETGKHVFLRKRNALLEYIHFQLIFMGSSHAPYHKIIPVCNIRRKKRPIALRRVGSVANR